MVPRAFPFDPKTNQSLYLQKPSAFARLSDGERLVGSGDAFAQAAEDLLEANLQRRDGETGSGLAFFILGKNMVVVLPAMMGLEPLSPKPKPWSVLNMSQTKNHDPTNAFRSC